MKGAQVSKYLIRESTHAEAGDCLHRWHTGHVAGWITRPFPNSALKYTWRDEKQVVTGFQG